MAVFLFAFALFADTWHFPEADVRLRLARQPEHPHPFTMRVDLPPLAGDWRVAGAHLADGTTLPTRPVRRDDRLVAVEVLFPSDVAGGANQHGMRDASDFPDAVPALLYLSASGREAAPPATPRQPFSVYAQTDQSITRPLNAAAVPPYWHRMGRPDFVHDSAAGKALEDTVAQTIAKGRQGVDQRRWRAMCHRIQISTTLHLSENADCRFGATASPAAWFMFVNGQPAGSWMESDGGPDDVALGPTVALPPGFHDVTFIIMARHGETPPLPVVKLGEKGATPAEDAFLPAHIPVAMRMEYREADVHPGVAWQTALLSLPNHGLAYHVVAIDDLTKGGGPERGETRFALPNKPFGGPGTFATQAPSPGVLRVKPAGETGEFSVALPRFPRQSIVIAMPEVFVDSLPLVVEPESSVAIDLLVQNLPFDLPPGIDAHASVAVETQDARGQPIERVELPVKTPDAKLTARVQIAENVSRIVVGAWLAGVPVTSPLELRLLAPGDDLHGLKAVGDRLVVDGVQAMLRLDHHSARPTPTIPQPQKTVRKGATVAWLDTFVAPGLAPGATDEPADRVAQGAALRVERFGPEVMQRSDALPELWKFELAARALSTTPGVMVLGVGVYDLKAGVHRDERFRRLLFLIQAALARDIVPIPVTSPQLPGVDREETRVTALALKRLALQLGLPACDAYSAALALTTQPGHPAFAAFGQASAPSITSQGMNDEGRRWFADLLTRSLLEIVGER